MKRFTCIFLKLHRVMPLLCWKIIKIYLKNPYSLKFKKLLLKSLCFSMFPSVPIACWLIAACSSAYHLYPHSWTIQGVSAASSLRLVHHLSCPCHHLLHYRLLAVLAVVHLLDLYPMIGVRTLNYLALLAVVVGRRNQGFG